MAIRSWLTLSLLYALVYGKPTRRDFQLHETRSGAPAGYRLSGTASPNTILNLRLALVRNDDAGLIDTLYDVSTPSSPLYGNHLTKEDVRVRGLLMISF